VNVLLSIEQKDLVRVASECASLRSFYDAIEIRVVQKFSVEEEDFLRLLHVPILMKVEDLSLLSSCSVVPWMIDIPVWFRDQLGWVRDLFPSVPVQGSLHLSEAILSYDMIEENQAFDSIKIAAMTRNTKEALSVMRFLVRYASSCRLTCIAMGEHAQWSRIVSAALGSYLTYTCLSGEPTAPGQLDLKIAHERFSLSRISRDTKLFGLIGDPVDSSVSDYTHTRMLRSFGVDGVYVKIPVALCELHECVSLLEKLSFVGLSVTTPLKEQIVGKPVNTVRWRYGHQEVCNTDAPALLDALHDHIRLKGVPVLVLGAGSVAKAVIPMLIEQGADVTVWNRTYEHAEALRSDFGVSVLPVLSCDHFFVVINTTSFWTEHPSFLDQRSVSLFAEYCYPQESTMLRYARSVGIQVISGKDLWKRQAAKQFHWWCSFEEQACRFFFDRMI